MFVLYTQQYILYVWHIKLPVTTTRNCTNYSSLSPSKHIQYDTDFYILDKYPLAVRPFYTMPDPHDTVSDI